MARQRYDVKSVADRYWNEQCERLGPITHATPVADFPFALPDGWVVVKASPRKLAPKRAAKGSRAALKALLTAQVPA